MVRIRRNQNQIDNIKDNKGKDVRGQEEIKKEAYRYYKNLLSSPTSNNKYEYYLQHIPRKINEVENNELTRADEEKKVAITIWDFNLDKALGPNGFPISSYKNNYIIIKKYLIRMIRNFLGNSRLEDSQTLPSLPLFQKSQKLMNLVDLGPFLYVIPPTKS